MSQVKVITLAGNQPGQHAFMVDRAPGETLYQGGFGAGKSFAGARKLLALHSINRCPSMALAPTYGDLWRFVVPKLVETLNAWRIPHRLLKGVAPTLTVWGEPIILLSCDRPERIAGFEVGAGWMDEGARVHVNVNNPLENVPLQARARIRHPKAKVHHLAVTTTPEGTATWVEREFIADPQAAALGRRVYYGSTLRNAALPENYKRDQLASIPAALREQYVEGKAVDFTGKRAHPGFLPSTHHHPSAVAVAGRPLHIGMDFNVSPLCWVAAQIDGTGREAVVRVVDELVIEDHATVEKAMHVAHAKGWGAFPAVHLHPDRSSNNRSVAGNPIAYQLAQVAQGLGWKYALRNDGGNPAINARIAVLDALIDPAAGPRRLLVNPSCKRLTRELMSVGRLTSGAYDPGREGQFGHILDALGYLVWDELRPGGGFASG